MDARRKKLLFRAWRRGFREMDLLMGSFADERIADMNDAELDEFEALLAEADWDVYAWVTGNRDVPEAQQGPVLDQLKQFKYSAQPG